MACYASACTTTSSSARFAPARRCSHTLRERPSTSLAGTPVLASTRFAPSFKSRASRRVLVVRASEESNAADRTSDTTPAAEATPSAATSQPPSGTEPAPEETLGFFGNLVMWSILLLTFAGSLFFTMSRQFLPDMIPLDAGAPPF